jgi:hypothetical protein
MIPSFGSMGAQMIYHYTRKGARARSRIRPADRCGGPSASVLCASALRPQPGRPRAVRRSLRDRAMATQAGPAPVHEPCGPVRAPGWAPPSSVSRPKVRSTARRAPGDVHRVPRPAPPQY